MSILFTWQKYVSVWIWNMAKMSFQSTVLALCPHFSFYLSLLFCKSSVILTFQTLLTSFCDLPLKSTSQRPWSSSGLASLWNSWMMMMMYRTTDCTNVLYSKTFVDLLMASAFHIRCRLLAIAAASPIILTTSLSHDAFCEIFPPK